MNSVKLLSHKFEHDVLNHVTDNQLITEVSRELPTLNSAVYSSFFSV